MLLGFDLMRPGLQLAEMDKFPQVKSKCGERLIIALGEGHALDIS